MKQTTELRNVTRAELEAIEFDYFYSVDCNDPEDGLVITVEAKSNCGLAASDEINSTSLQYDNEEDVKRSLADVLANDLARPRQHPASPSGYDLSADSEATGNFTIGGEDDTAKAIREIIFDGAVHPDFEELAYDAEHRHFADYRASGLIIDGEVIEGDDIETTIHVLPLNRFTGIYKGHARLIDETNNKAVFYDFEVQIPADMFETVSNYKGNFWSTYLADDGLSFSSNAKCSFDLIDASGIIRAIAQSELNK